MPVPMLRAMLVFSALALIAASGRAGDDDGGEEQATGNKIVFDTGSPSSPGPNQLKVSGVALKGSTAWKCDSVLIELIGSDNKTAYSVNKASTPAFSATFTNIKSGTYTVKVSGTFKNGTNNDPKEVVSGKIIVQ